MPKQKNILFAPAWYDPRIHRGIVKYAAEHHWHLVADMARTPAVPFGWQGDGIITSLYHSREGLTQLVDAADCPVVELTASDSQKREIKHVMQDNIAIGRLAAEHFLERGFQNFAWIGISTGLQNTRRYDGFADCLTKAGFEAESIVWSREGSSDRATWEHRRDWLLKHIRQIGFPLALLVHNDYLAANVIDACAYAGLSVPDDVAIMGIENNELVCNSLSTPLSSIDIAPERHGYAAARALDRLLRGETDCAEELVAPRGVVTRQSTDFIAIPHAAVSAAIRYIREHVREPMSVPDVTVASGINRRALELAFREHVGRGIAEEVTREKMKLVGELLIETKLSLSEIADATGYSTVQYMHRVFRNFYGTTPKRFREERRSSASKRNGAGRSR